jgi:hypothetical protein
MLFARRNPDHVTGPDFAGLAAPDLNPAKAGNHCECLAERMGVPMGSRTRLEAHHPGTYPGRRRSFDNWILPDGAGK